MENPKFHFTYTLPCKIVCFLLSVALSVVIVAGGLVSVYGMNEGWFDYNSKSFYESGFASRMAYEYSDDIVYGYLYDNSWAGAIDNVNLLFVLYDENGKALTQNCDGDRAVFISEVPFVVETWENDVSAEYWYTIKYWLRAPLVKGDGFYAASTIYNWAADHRTDILAWTVVAAIAFVVCLVLLVCGAGCRSDVEGVSLAWINRKVPFDLHFFAAVCAGIIMCLCFAGCVDIFANASLRSVLALALVGGAACTAAFFALCTHILICFSARVKAGKWWRNTLCCKVVRFFWRIVKKIFGAIKSVLFNLPLVWKSVLVFCAAAFINIILAMCMLSSFFAFFLLFLFDCALLVGVGFIALQMRRLQQGGQELSKGNFDYKINTEGLFWEFRRHAEDLNSVSEGMTIAVNERMKSERFKTELITNVSHDIKTPLTSIISYVDLLKKENIQNEKAQEYIEVIDRQSTRLKKLTEDLVEASKASSGAVKLDMDRVDVGELLRQSVGEYNERLTEAGLTTIMNLPEKPLPVMADGRRIWRIFENLLSNICKYAMSGTRAYITAEGVHGGVFVTFRNISTNELNISPDELMERFVRGDTSRSTEGSGLGLSIARSLTELMGGHFDVFLDGDLFKAVVSFPMLYEAEQDLKSDEQ